MHWLSLAIIVVFGGATLMLHDETFIKWKPTVLYWLFGAVLSGRAGRVPSQPHRGPAQGSRRCPTPVWARITWAWIAFLAAMGAANLYVAFHFTIDTWVNFKVWGGIGLFMLAAVGTVASVARYLPEQS